MTNAGNALRPYQQEAVMAVCDALHETGRGQVLMACGTGKTRVACQIVTNLVIDGLTIVACPSIALVSQILGEFAAAGYTGRAFAMCSDNDAGDMFVDRASLPCPTGSQAAQLAHWLTMFPSGSRLVVSTYQSVDQVGVALRHTGQVAELLVCDEAHHTAGVAGKQAAVVHVDSALPARRRLYMTATPRYLSAGVARGRRTDEPTVSMDEADRFGPTLYTYPFSRAIADGWLDDYRLAVVGVTRPDVLALLRTMGPRDVTGLHDEPLRQAVTQAALGKAAARFGLRRVIVFTPRIADAASFARTLGGVVERLPAAERPSGPLYAAHVSGEMSLDQRSVPMRRLDDPPVDGWTVITNARCLSEGVDVPAVDGVVFSHPKASTIDVIQSVGRALRRNPEGTGTATVLVPILLPDEDDGLSDVGDAAEYAALWTVVRALRAHDDTFAAELDVQRSLRPEEVGDPRPSQLRKLALVLPDGYDSSVFARHLTVRVVRAASSVWWEGYGAACAYHTQHGHLDVPAKHVAADGFLLGSWVAKQRGERKTGRLPAERIASLDAIGMRWDPLGDRFRTYLGLLAAYQSTHGHARVLRGYVTADGVKLGDWVSSCRADYHAGRLPADRVAALDALGMVWVPPPRWQEALDAARAFHAREGHLRVPMRHVEGGVPLGTWVKSQRVGPVSAELRSALDALGMAWDPGEEKWQRGLAATRAFLAREGHLRVPRGHVEDDVRLDVWMGNRRTDRRQGRLAADRVETLDQIGFPWAAHERTWDASLKAAQAFYAREGHLLPSAEHRENGVWLNAWLTRRRREQREGKLDPNRAAALDKIGMAWEPGRGAQVASLKKKKQIAG